MSLNNNVADVINNVEGKFAEAMQRLCEKVSMPMIVGHGPELDTT
jgi:hypothetical protein